MKKFILIIFIFVISIFGIFYMLFFTKIGNSTISKYIENSFNEKQNDFKLKFDTFIISFKYASSSPNVWSVLKTLWLISAAALFVKVRVKISLGFAPFRSKLIYLTVNAKVFPLPALAFNAKYFSINSFYYISF